MPTPKQPVINPVLITYINYSITENYIGKMASSFLPYTQCGASPQSSATNSLTFVVAQLQFLRESETFRWSTVRGFRTWPFDLR